MWALNIHCESWSMGFRQYPACCSRVPRILSLERHLLHHTAALAQQTLEFVCLSSCGPCFILQLRVEGIEILPRLPYSCVISQSLPVGVATLSISSPCCLRFVFPADTGPGNLWPLPFQLHLSPLPYESPLLCLSVTHVVVLIYLQYMLCHFDFYFGWLVE